MNIAQMMIPKVFTAFLHEGDSVRKGLEIMLNHGYTAIPVLDGEERYIGCVCEGDFLRHILNTGTTDRKFHEQYLIGSIVRKDFCPAIHIEAEKDEVIGGMLNQNFLPVVDSRNMLCGILTRSGVIKYLAGKVRDE